MPIECDIDLLPASACALAELIGLAALNALLEWRGGAYFNVPLKFDEKYELCRVIERPAAERLIERHAGEQLDLPRCAASARAAVWAEIVARRNAGESEIAVARAYGYTVRGIRDVMRRARMQEEGRQGELEY